ncbi:site-2 protease family protein [[Eubacterium] cellulosolvens]
MSVRIGKILGISIRIHYSLLLIFFLVVWSLAMGYMPQQYPDLSAASYWAIGVVSGLILFASVIIHEVCHSVVGRRFGVPIHRITLFFLGGAAEMTEEPKNASVEFKMALAGPLSSFGIAALLGGLWYISAATKLMTEVTAVLQYGAMINLILGGFNLLPAFPLDGGRVFRSILWWRKANLIKATRIATKVGVALSYVMMFGGFVMIVFGGFFNGLWIIFIGWFIKSGAEAGLSQTIISEALSGTTVEEIMSRDIVTVDYYLSLEELVNSYFLSKRFVGYPVLRDGALVGLVTVDRLKDVPRNLWGETSVGSVMKPLSELVVVEPETPASDAMYKMSKSGVGRILVMKGSELRGIVSSRDLSHLIKVKVELEEELRS